MMKKAFSVILALVMLVGMFAMTGCTGTGSSAADFVIPEGGYDGSEVTIVFYHTMGESLRNVLETYIAEFNQLYPNITIKHEQVGGYDDVRDQIKTELTTDAQPNIAYCYPDHVALYNMTGKVITLDDLIASTIEITRADGTTEVLGLTAEQIADFIPGYYNEGKVYGDGKMYTMPMSKSTEVLYYNATFFEQHNLTVPTTWEEMEAVCEQIKAIDPTSIPLGYDSESNWFINMCMQYGSDYTSATGDHYLFDNETNFNFVKMFREWYQKGYVSTETIYGTYTSGLFNGSDSVQSYMCIGSSAGANHQRPTANADGTAPFEIGIATIPQVNPEKPQVISQGPSLCIFSSENVQEVIASWLFIKYLTTTVEFQAAFSMTSGYVPVLKSVADNEIYADFLAKANGTNYVTALSAKVCLEQADAYYVSPAFNGSSTARDEVGALMVACLTGKWADSEVDAKIRQIFADAIDECEYWG